MKVLEDQPETTRESIMPTADLNGRASTPSVHTAANRAVPTAVSVRKASEPDCKAENKSHAPIVRVLTMLKANKAKVAISHAAISPANREVISPANVSTKAKEDTSPASRVISRAHASTHRTANTSPSPVRPIIHATTIRTTKNSTATTISRASKVITHRRDVRPTVHVTTTRAKETINPVSRVATSSASSEAINPDSARRAMTRMPNTA